MRALLLWTILFLGVASCSRDDGSPPIAYRTDGTAKLQVCTGAGIEKCDYEPQAIPELVDPRDRRWSGIRSEYKSSTRTMCYLDQPDSLFTKRLLMFACKPIREGEESARGIQAELEKQRVLESLTNLALASASFEVCAFESSVDADTSMEWIGHSLELSEMAESLSTHYSDDAMMLVYEMQRVSAFDSAEFKSQSLDQTNQCDNSSLRGAESFVAQSREVVSFYVQDGQ